LEVANNEEDEKNASPGGKTCKDTCYSVKPVVWSILVGDGLHNAVDGVAIAIAFKACSASAGWVVLVGTVAHEIPQELADYLILTLEGGVRPGWALLWNFLSGATCIVAGLIASSVEASDETQAGLLGFGWGVRHCGLPAEN
jgi:zinc transporter ZupT